MKLSASANSLNKKDVHLDLHNFRMNLSRTLNSNFLKKFHDLTNQDTSKKETETKSKFRNRLSSTPSMPVKVTNGYISTNPNVAPIFDDFFQLKKQNSTNEFIQSKCQSPFLLRRSIQSDEVFEFNPKIEHPDSYSIISSNVSTLRMKECNQSDSGLSSLNSAQLFFAEIKETLKKTEREGSIKSSSHRSLKSNIINMSLIRLVKLVL